MSIPVLGTIVGLIIGNHYQKEALQTLTTTYQEQQVLNHLQSTILQNRPAKELTPLVDEPVAFQQAGDNVLTRLSQLQQLVNQLEASETKAVADFRVPLQTYQIILATFVQEVQTLMQEGQQLQADGNGPLLEQRILAVVNGKTFSAVIQFADQIEGVARAMEEDVLAAKQGLERAEILRMQIILGSMSMSVVVAVLLAMVTSQAISRPLESLTQVAQQVTRDSDTTLRAAIPTQDEVGSLATALNQLIEWVETYTQELKETQLHLIQAEKMSSLGQLVAGVAHEINNPVNFIHGNLGHAQDYTRDLLAFLQLYQQHYPNPGSEIQSAAEEMDLAFIQTDLPKILSSMQVGTERIRQIVLSLRNFSRTDEAEIKSVDLHDGLNSTLMILQHRLKARPERPEIEVVREYGDLPLVECYAGPLNQVFMNILTNAIDALEDKNARHTFQELSQTPNRITIRTSVIDAMWVQVAIADNGPGIPKEVQQRIFNPFFTTKPVGKGTGMGMSISYQIITDQHGGTLTCLSAPGQGAEFVIQIPIRQPHAS